MAKSAIESFTKPATCITPTFEKVFGGSKVKRDVHLARELYEMCVHMGLRWCNGTCLVREDPIYKMIQREFHQAHADCIYQHFQPFSLTPLHTAPHPTVPDVFLVYNGQHTLSALERIGFKWFPVLEYHKVMTNEQLAYAVYLFNGGGYAGGGKSRKPWTDLELFRVGRMTKDQFGLPHHTIYNTVVDTCGMDIILNNGGTSENAWAFEKVGAVCSVFRKYGGVKGLVRTLEIIKQTFVDTDNDGQPMHKALEYDVVVGVAEWAYRSAKAASTLAKSLVKAEVTPVLLKRAAGERAEELGAKGSRFKLVQCVPLVLNDAAAGKPWITA